MGEPGLAGTAIGLGAMFVTGHHHGQRRHVRRQGRTRRGPLINTSLQLGSALGLATFSAIATAHTNDLLAAATPLRTSNSRRQTTQSVFGHYTPPGSRTGRRA
jgi:hypothetical protein